MAPVHKETFNKCTYCRGHISKSFSCITDQPAWIYIFPCIKKLVLKVTEKDVPLKPWEKLQHNIVSSMYSKTSYIAGAYVTKKSGVNEIAL